MRTPHTLCLCAVGILLTSCGTKPIQPSSQHMQRDTTPPVAAKDIPQPITSNVVLPPPRPAVKTATYSVVVTNVPAQEILFALARDAKINLDIHGGIEGLVTINAINQTLPQILNRIAKQVDMRYELDNGTLTVMPDKAFLRTYKIDFINIARTSTSTNTTSSQIGSGAAGSTGTPGGNASITTVKSDTKNDLMTSLVANIKEMILDEDRLHYQEQVDLQTQQQIQARGAGAASGSTSLAAPKGNSGTEINQAGDGGKINRGNTGTGGSASGRGNQDVQGQGEAVAKKGVYERAVNVFANNETGVLIVRATSRQHEKVQEFIDKVMATAKRQVLIEATIVEVRLNDQYQQGINWSRLLLGAKGFALSQAGTTGFQANQTTGLATTAGALAVTYLNPTSKFGNITASVQLLEQFGNVKVLSSPKLSVMNNQTASLKVADSKVYFTVTSTPALLSATGTVVSPATYTTTPIPVSVGLTMSVTPQISDADTVTINVRPAITRIISYATDPNPTLLIPNLIPEIQTREMESIIKVDSGQTAVMGGLIQEDMNLSTKEIPLLGRIPFFGNLFQNRNDTTTKTELVIFLRPVVIKEASTNGDYSEFRDNLPDQEFFHESASGKP